MAQSEAPYVPLGVSERPAPFRATPANQADDRSSRRAAQPGLLRLIAEDYQTHERKWSKPGFHTMVMYRFGAWRCRLPPIPRKLLRFPYWLMHTWCRNFYGIELHETATIGRRCRIAHQSGIVIHEYAVIGDDCIIRQGVTIGSAGPWSKDDVPTIGDGVSVGAGATIVGRIRIGNNVQIGPNVAVMRNIPAGSTVVMPPPRILAPGSDDRDHG